MKAGHVNSAASAQYTQTHHWRNEANSSTTTTTWIFDVSWVELLLMFFFLFFQPNNHRSPHHFFLLLLFLNFVVMITSLIIIQNLLYMPGRTVKTTFVKTLILFYSIYYLIIEFLWCCFSFLFQRLSLSLDDKSVNDPRKIKKKEEEKERTDKLVIHLPPFSLSLSLQLILITLYVYNNNNDKRSLYRIITSHPTIPVKRTRAKDVATPPLVVAVSAATRGRPNNIHTHTRAAIVDNSSFLSRPRRQEKKKKLKS